MDLGLQRAHVEDGQLAVQDEPPLLRERILLGQVREVLGGCLGEVARDDDAVVAVATHLVIVDLDALVDLTERDVELAHEHVLLVGRVGVQAADELKRLRVDRKVLVHDELVTRLEEEFLHAQSRDHEVGLVLLVELVDPVGDLDLQLSLVD